MKIINYYDSKNNEYWLGKIRQCDWDAGQYLATLIEEDSLKKLCGQTTQVLLLTKDNQLLAFCTYAEQDDIPNTALTPWVGFVYTFPTFRCRGCMGLLLNYAQKLAMEQGHSSLYISTNHIGLYEKYGYQLFAELADIAGEQSRVYKKTF